MGTVFSDGTGRTGIRAVQTAAWEAIVSRRRSHPAGAKPLNILTALVAAHGDLVTKDELIVRVWPGMVVEENAIQAHISAIRKLLGEDARMIMTVPGGGYRFSGLVEFRTGEQPELESAPVTKPTPPPVQRKAAQRHPVVPFAFRLAMWL